MIFTSQFIFGIISFGAFPFKCFFNSKYDTNHSTNHFIESTPSIGNKEIAVHHQFSKNN